MPSRKKEVCILSNIPIQYPLLTIAPPSALKIMSRLSLWEPCNSIYSSLLTLLSPLMGIRALIHTSNAHISRYVYRSASFISQLAVTVEYYVSIKPDSHDKTDKMLKLNIKLNIPHGANIS